jgi:hypothetical protein
MCLGFNRIVPLLAGFTEQDLSVRRAKLGQGHFGNVYVVTSAFNNKKKLATNEKILS